MFRHTLSTVVVVFLVAVVGAQGPRTISGQQQGDLYKKNRLVIEEIVDRTLESSRKPNDYVERANTYYKVVYKFNLEINQARQANDNARIEELSKHLGTLLDNGLAPTLVKARGQVEGGTGVEAYIKVRNDLLAQLDALLGMLGDNPAAKASLDGAKKRLNEIRTPE
ncbi:MAG TPA: hypothetical protein VHR66_02745 [Gemmataceae bacterium]|jgi:hypothetical protein|nr:hypothetical protein [Gemmataceae bacterium]